MPLPIIIVFQRNFDPAPQSVIKNLLKPLSVQGYDTLCLETPQHMTVNDMEGELQKTLAFVEKLNSDAVALLKQQNIAVNVELSSVNYSKLAELMMYFVSSRRFNEVAYNIKHLPAMRVQKEMLSTAKQQAMLVQGVNSGNSSFDLLYENGLSAVVSDLDKNMHDNNNVKATNLVRLSKQRKGLILFSGCANAPDLIAALDKCGLRENVLYYFLHSDARFDSSIDDLAEVSKNVVFANHMFGVNDANEIAAFTKKLNEDIAAKSPQFVPVEVQQETSQFGRFFQNIRNYVAPAAGQDAAPKAGM